MLTTLTPTYLQRAKNALAKTAKFLAAHRGQLMALALAVALVIPGYAYASPSATPSLDIDFSSALQTIFDYASLIFLALIPISAIGIGFNMGGSLLSWVGKMLSDAFRFR